MSDDKPILSEAEHGDMAFTRKSPYGTRPEPTYAGALSFSRRLYSRDLAGVDVAVVGIPYDMGTTGRSGTRLGPRAIRSASAMISWAPPWPWTYDPYDRMAVIDYGDILFDIGRPDTIADKITKGIGEILAADVATLALGGDHFITYPVLRAYAQKHGQLALIHFDAHSDTWRDADDRIDHGTMFYHAARQGIIDPAHSIQIGIRTHNPETHGFTIIDARQATRMSGEAIAARIKSQVGNMPCYLTFDVDCLDPAFAPGTGTPVPGGLSNIQALEIIRALPGINLVGMDVVEVAPQYDVGEITALAAANLANEILAVYAHKFPDRDNDSNGE